MKKKRLIFRITFVALYLILATIYIYIPKRIELAGALSFITPIDMLKLEQLSNGVVFSYPYPISDDEAFNGEDTIFKIKNYDDNKLSYQIKAIKYEKEENIKYVDLENIKYSYKIGDGEYTKPQNLNSDGIIDISEINGNSNKLYYVKFWIDENLPEEEYSSSISIAVTLENL